MDKKPLFFYGWIVLAIAFVSMVVANITRNSFSVLYVVILDEFGWNRANTAGIFSANTLGFGITVPDAKKGISRYMNFYNQERPHQSLDYKTPAEVYFGIDNQNRETSRYLKEATFVS